jgi:hypothetical protein
MCMYAHSPADGVLCEALLVCSPAGCAPYGSSAPEHSACMHLGLRGGWDVVCICIFMHTCVVLLLVVVVRTCRQSHVMRVMLCVLWLPAPAFAAPMGWCQPMPSSAMMTWLGWLPVLARSEAHMLLTTKANLSLTVTEDVTGSSAALRACSYEHTSIIRGQDFTSHLSDVHIT